MPTYILYLYKQYCDSIGKEYIQINIFNDNDFFIWIKELYKNTLLYREYIDSIGIVIGKYESIEIGKGKYDSIGQEFTTIVSPYADTMNLCNSRLIISDYTPVIICDSKIYSAQDCNSFITHNPFTESDIQNIMLIHNMGLNVCLGIYGDNSDKDKAKKLEMLNKCISLMTNDLQFYYDTTGTKYLACIKSNRKVKVKTLTR